MYQTIKKPWLGALFVFIFGPFGFLYYSWKKALVVFLLFFLPNLIIYNLDYGVAAEIFRWIIQIVLAVYAYFDIDGKLNIFENILSGIIGTIIVPIIFLNFFGEIVGAIWLLIIGQWQLVIIGVIISFIFPFIYSIISLVTQFPLGGLALWAEKKNKKILMLVLGFISMFIGHIIILFYVLYVADKAIIIAELANINILAMLLFGYGVATGPFSYMAKSEPSDAIGTFIAVFIAQLSFIIIAIAYLLNYPLIAVPIILIFVFGLEVYLLSITSKAFDYEKITRQQ
ncbi:MAG: hypothetical protein Q7S77_00700 [Candidatus Staskawiczbacteria bacterium]|nr:hypothetical protein [Candidatus Staskawiczbacteria bacterium]